MRDIQQLARRKQAVRETARLSEYKFFMEPNRTCGTCTLCCRLVEVKELSKPRNKTCVHCNPGQGCTVYPHRPESCQNFACLWIRGLVPEEMQPEKIHAVLDVTADNVIVIHLDDHRQDVLSNQLLTNYITTCYASGLPLLIMQGQSASHISRLQTQGENLIDTFFKTH